jgi:hypothetical protein
MIDVRQFNEFRKVVTSFTALGQYVRSDRTHYPGYLQFIEFQHLYMFRAQAR